MTEEDQGPGQKQGQAEAGGLAARLLLGAPVAAEIRASTRDEVAAFVGRRAVPPVLAIVSVGGDESSAVYVRQILRACDAVGIQGRLVELGGDGATPDTSAPSEAVATRHEAAGGGALEARTVEAIQALNRDASVAGIIVQQPLPAEVRLRAVVEAIDPAKDIDGIHPLNVGLLRLGYGGVPPATAHAAIEILEHYEIPMRGRDAVVVGRSSVVGMPVASMLARRDATVTVCHSKTRDLAAHVGRAEILVVAAGRPGLVTADMLRPGVVIIDVGINVVGDGLVGDVDFEAALAVASAITPVPGGVGPVTSALLLRHLIRAAMAQEAGSSR